MSLHTVLRPATDADIPFLFRVYASSRADEMALVDWSDEQKQDFLQMQFDAQHSYYHENYAQARFDVIEVDGETVGRLYVDRREDEIRIIDIALLPEFQRRGTGSALIRSILDEARDSGRSVTIHVEQNNPAMALYTRLGFQHVRDVSVYYFMRWDSTGDRLEDNSSGNSAGGAADQVSSD
jgi:ribosomal protein S18 acetylase RimI-like enzyme